MLEQSYYLGKHWFVREKRILGQYCYLIPMASYINTRLSKAKSNKETRVLLNQCCSSHSAVSRDQQCKLKAFKIH